MNEKIDLTELLKDCPLGTRFYMSVLGEQVKLDSTLKTETEHPIIVKAADGNIFYLSKYGQLFAQYKYGDCILWPSEECRDWSKFKVPVKKFNPRTLHPFDKVIVRLEDQTFWTIDFFSFVETKNVKCVGGYFNRCVPYNDDTKHLLGTSDEAPEYYKYWED